MLSLTAVLMAAVLPAVPLPRGAVTNAIPAAKGAPATWEAEGKLPLPYAEARARLLTSLAGGAWKFKQTIPMHTQRTSAEILLFESRRSGTRQSAELFVVLQSTGPSSASFSYRREAKR